MRTSEAAWLIEHPDTSKEVRYLRTHEPEWTTDVYDALHFFRKQDAEDFALLVYESEGPLNAVEHVFEPNHEPITDAEIKQLDPARDRAMLTFYQESDRLVRESLDEYRKALSDLVLAARTGGQKAGPDRFLMECCDKAEALFLRDGPINPAGDAVNTHAKLRMQWLRDELAEAFVRRFIDMRAHLSTGNYRDVEAWLNDRYLPATMEAAESLGVTPPALGRKRTMSA